MANNYISTGDRIPLAAPYAVASGAGALVGTLFGVALQTLANGITGEFAIRGVWDLAKATGAAWTVGAALYWDNTNKNVTTTSAGNTKIGVAAVAAASGDTVGRVRLNGSF
mgnify:CR=1 FL=1